MAKSRVDDRAAVEQVIAGLPAFGAVAARLHEIVVRTAPDLFPRLWYGMPGYARTAKGPVVCFFRVDDDRFVTFGLTEHAHHAPDPAAGHLLMPSAWFLTDLDAPTEEKVAAVVRAAVRADDAPGAGS